MKTIELEYVDALGSKERQTLAFSDSLLDAFYKRESLFVMQVDGCSMEPLILDGALVVADLSQTSLIENAIYIISHDAKTWIKRYKKSRFISLNQDFAHLIYPSSKCRVIARVLLTFTKL